MCQLSRESEPVGALGVREDKYSLLSNTETPRDPTHPLGRVGTAQHLSRWESRDQDLIHGRKKASPEEGRTGGTHSYTHLKEAVELGLASLPVCLLLCLLFKAAKQAGWKFIFGPLHPASQIGSPFL